MAFSSAFCKELPAANAIMRRFDGRYFHVDFPLSAVCTILSDDPTQLELHCEFRSNRDMIGLLWTSKDKFGHPMLSYVTDLDYRGTKLAFVANPPDPYNFTVTIRANMVDNVYRCFPFKVEGGSIVPDITDSGIQGTGPGSSYAISEVFPDGLTVPAGHHIYMVDFDNVKLGYNYEKGNINSQAVQQLFFALVPGGAGLGAGAKLANAGSMTSAGGAFSIKTAETLTEWRFQNINPNLRLSKGDVIMTTLSYPGDVMEASNKGVTYKLKTETLYIPVEEWSGDGTTERRIKATVPLENSVWLGGPALAFKLQKDTALGSQALNFKMTNISCTGARRDIAKRYYPQPVHNMMMTTGYDDTYNITPWRQLDNTYNLGYRGYLTMYMGMSHYFKAESSGGFSSYQNKVVKDAALPLNYPTQRFCEELFRLAQVYNYAFVWSTSYEILDSYMPDEWKQRDANGQVALSGWAPPSSFFIPTNPECTSYMARVINHGMALIAASGITNLMFQIGEPWWWDGSYTNGAPCIYDNFTMSLYTAETGLAVPTPFFHNYLEAIPPTHRPYLEWLGDKLGQSTNAIRNEVKAAHPTSKGTLLFFTPQIMNPSAEMLTIINFPKSYWVYPNYEFVQIEDYDWIIDGHLDRMQLTLDAAVVVLGYPLSVVHYFLGFVNSTREKWVWPNINVVTRDAKAANIPNIYIWAYPQIIRDGILYDDSIIQTATAVMPPIPARRQMPAAIGDNEIRPIYFCRIGDDVFMNSSDKNIEFDGHTWYATGQFGSITTLTEGVNKTDAGWSMTLQGVPLAQLDAALDSLRAKSATLYMGLVDPGHTLLHPPKVIGSGPIVRNNAKIEDNTGSVVIDVKSKLSNWSMASAARYTDEFQQFKHPGDRGFRFLSALSNQKINWGK